MLVFHFVALPRYLIDLVINRVRNGIYLFLLKREAAMWTTLMQLSLNLLSSRTIWSRSKAIPLSTGLTCITGFWLMTPILLQSNSTTALITGTSKEELCIGLSECNIRLPVEMRNHNTGERTDWLFMTNQPLDLTVFEPPGIVKCWLSWRCIFSVV